MKIAIFYNLPIGGAKRVVCEQVKGLSKKHLIDLYRLNEQKNEFLDIDKFCKNVYKYNFKLESSLPYFLNRLHRDFKNFIIYGWVQKNIANDIDKRNYDCAIIHSDGFTESPMLLRYLRTPNIFYDHEILSIVYKCDLESTENISILKRYYEYLIRKIRKQIDLKNVSKVKNIITNSRYMQKFIRNI